MGDRGNVVKSTTSAQCCCTTYYDNCQLFFDYFYGYILANSFLIYQKLTLKWPYVKVFKYLNNQQNAF